MLKNTIKIFFRNLIKHPGNSLSNILGLSVGITTCILILLFVQYEFNWNTDNEKYDRIYRLQSMSDTKGAWQVDTQTGFALASEVKDKFPEIEDAAVLGEIWGEYLSSSEEKTFNEGSGYYADKNAFKIFSFNFVQGNINDALSEPYCVVITETMAKKYFPNENAYGKNLKATKNKILKVTGIIKDFPVNSDFRPDYLVSMKTLFEVTEWKDFYKLENITASIYRTFVTLKPNILKDEMNDKLKNFLDNYVSNNQKTCYLKPLSEIHLTAGEHKDAEFALYATASLAFFILILSCINFINLSTASSNLRKKEIGVRKVVGASRKTLFLQFLSESFAITFISMVLALLFAELILPYFNTIVQRQLPFNFFMNTQFILLMAAIFVVAGVLSGIYPAAYLSSFRPAEIIKSGVFNPVKNKKGFLRKSLVGFQFFVSLLLIITTIYVIKQVSLMNNKDLGFDKKNLVIVKVFGEKSDGNFSALKNELVKNNNIIDASLSSTAPFISNWGREINWEGSTASEKMNIMYNNIGYDFIDTYKMEIVKGRNFSREFSTDDKACLINETAWKQLGWDDPIGRKLDSSKYTVVGVVKDFHQFSVHSLIPPFYLTLNPEKLADNGLYSIRIKPENAEETIKYVRAQFKSFFPNAIIEASIYESILDVGTRDLWTIVEKLFSIFTVIAILIAANGLFGLVSFSTQRRTKEIGIRKVLGANSGKLYWMMSSEIVVIFVLAAVLAIPSGYYQSQMIPGAYKYQLQFIDYFLSVGLMLITALAATTYHTTKAVYTNPVKSLRYE
ncbi:MAG: FtsX-like permease family protein [Ignavibacteria bacterium]|nr:FtsX-like permease family protein [Ignavibacteria bacterium]